MFQLTEMKFLTLDLSVPSGNSPSPKTTAELKKPRRSVSMEPLLKAKSKAFPQPIRSKMKKSTSYSWLQDKKTQFKSQDKMFPLELPKTAPPVPPQSSKATEQDKKLDYSHHHPALQRHHHLLHSRPLPKIH